ncbi:hypothetical protein ACFX2B_004977 [Malus domestica]
MAPHPSSSDSSSPATSSGSTPLGEISTNVPPSIAMITVQNIAGMVPTKLNRHNYITWRSLFLPVLKRFKLLGLLTGDDPCPPPCVRDSSGSQIPNSAYELWCERDQILTIWINSTLAEDLLPLTIGMEDSHSLWQSLERRFAGASRTHVHSLQSKIQTIQKGDASMTEYLNTIKDISDKFAAAGESISDSDLVAYILAGLPDEYESFVDSIETRTESVNGDELHGLLLSKEISLQKRKTRQGSTSSSSAPFHAYTAQQGSSGSPSFRGNFRGKYQNQNRNQYHNRNRFPQNRNFGANRQHNSSGGILGPAPSRSSFSGAHSGPIPGSSQPGQSIPCQLYNQYGHSALYCGSLSQFASHRSSPMGFNALTGSHPLSYWITDSGATHHVTPDPASLNSATPYTGTEQLFVGDGKGLCISHTGNALIRTPNDVFKLHDVLLVSQASHNLLSVYKFVYDNCCSLTFDPFGFYIKDLRTGRMLFQGPSEGGLYPFY